MTRKEMQAQRRRPYAALEAAISAGIEMLGVGGLAGYCKAVSIAHPTLNRRRNAPLDLTLGELKKIAVAADMPLGELCEKIGGK